MAPFVLCYDKLFSVRSLFQPIDFKFMMIWYVQKIHVKYLHLLDYFSSTVGKHEEWDMFALALAWPITLCKSTEIYVSVYTVLLYTANFESNLSN